MEASACVKHTIFWRAMERSFMFLLVMNVMPHSLVDRHKHLEELLSPSWGQKQAESPSKTWVTHQHTQRHNHGCNCNGTWTLQEEKGLCLNCTRLNHKRRNTTKAMTNYKIKRKVLKFLNIKWYQNILFEFSNIWMTSTALHSHVHRDDQLEDIS